MPRVNIVQEEESPVQKDVLANEIIRMAGAVNKLLLSGLNEKAIVVLLRDATGLSKRNITLVLNALAQLREDYTHD